MYQAVQIQENLSFGALRVLNKIFISACGFVLPIVEGITKLLRIK